MRQVLLVVGLFLSAAPFACASALPADQAQAFVDAHNQVRASVEPAPAEPLPPLTWDEDAAAVASSWAAQCRFEHNPNPGERGENLAFFSTGLGSTPEDVVESWASERADYDYAANTCEPGRQCGHYTQVVWRETTRVGCGVARCTLEGFEGLLWVCNYEPPGNYVGERPY